MKRVLPCILMLASSAPATSFADGAAQSQTAATFEPLVIVDETGANASIEGTFSRSFDKSRWGASGFWWVTRDWAEAYAGPTWTPKEGVVLGLGLGAEQQGAGQDVRFRYALSLMIDTEIAYLSTSFEHNTGLFRNEQAGLWYDTVSAYKLGEHVGLGVRSRRGVGSGPYIEARIPKAHLRPWVSWAVMDIEHPDRTDIRRFFGGLIIEL